LQVQDSAARRCWLPSESGYDVDIYEQAPQLGEVGAGIQMSANAMHVLNYLGVGDEISERSVVLPHMFSACTTPAS
jgi:2-polyprenyl-6-methoxyphenol hydroxylase-like FAD-dependent oxidoreductase